MKKIFLILIIGLLANTFLYSQYIDNALRFSQNNYGGTARFVGMGGAFCALGGDFSSISINPAGLGVYRSSEFIFSPGLSYDNNSSTYINNKIDDSKYAVNLNNWSFVISYDLENSDTRWVSANFGVGFNRINNFNSNIRFEGVNNNSIMEVFVDEANASALTPDDLDGMYEYLLFDTYVIDTSGGVFFSDITNAVINDPNNFEINQRKTIEREGAISEFSFAFGGNYAHKLYIGASIGITRLRFKEYASHYEYETIAFPITFTDAFDFREHSTITGTGFNFKVGLIYKPIEFLRIGAAFHLPTFYNLDQEYYNEAMGYFETMTVEPSKSPIQTYNYQLNTPLRAIGGLGFQIGKVGLFDVDYEYVDYSKMEMDDEFSSQEVNDDNTEIERIFQATHNLRIGAEFRYGLLYFRAGGRYSTSPYKDVEGVLNPTYERIAYSGGIGYREKKFFIDFAFSQTLLDYKMLAYDYEFNTALADIKNKMNNFVLTFGVKF